jgi:L-rhamnose mutarotase
MNRIIKNMLAWVTLLALPVLAQTTAPVLYVQVDYMKPAPGKTAEYIDVERKIWKPIHEARVKTGIIVSWSLYVVWYHPGENAEYSHVTINIYGDFNKMKDDYSTSVLQSGHPKASAAQIDEMMARTNASREIVRSELWVLRESVATDKPAPYVQVNYMKVAPGQDEEYFKVEREIWKPIHQTAKAAGIRAGWGVYSLMYPGGTQVAYNFGTADFFDEFSDLAVNLSQELVQKAHPAATAEKWTAMLQRTIAAREHVRLELWELLDQVDASSSVSAAK